MAKNEKTSKRVGKIASKVLKDPKASPEAKTPAGSALTQLPDKRTKKPKT